MVIHFHLILLSNATKMDLLRSSGISPLLYISFITSMIWSILKRSKTENFSAAIRSEPASLFLFLLSSADLSSDFNISSHSIFLSILYLSLPPLSLSRRERFSGVFAHLWVIFLILLSLTPYFGSVQPVDELIFYPVYSVILLCIPALSTVPHISLQHIKKTFFKYFKLD